MTLAWLVPVGKRRKRMMKFISIPALAVCGALSYGVAEAATLEITGVTGKWSSVQTTETTANLSGLGSSAISWGKTSRRARQSGYAFKGLAPSGFLTEDDVFDIGTLTHQNRPIASGTSILGATLTVIFDLLIDGNSSKIISLFNFDHFETANQAKLCANGGVNGVGVNIAGCADRLTAKTNPGSSETFIIDGMEYFLELTGFLVEGNPLTEFWTIEGKTNPAILQARFTAKPTDLPAPIPLPATGLFLLAAMGGLAAFGARRRRA